MLCRLRLARLFVLPVVAALLAMSACSKDKNPARPSTDDVTPPAAVANLAAVSPTSTSIALTWTATGDDTTVGRASQYDIRYCGVEITEANWDSVGVVRVVGAPVPGEAGSRESFVVAGLSAGETYYFAVKVGDERPNWSGMSNVASGTTRAGSGWFALGTGMSAGVYALAEYNGQLIAGGYITTAGGGSANGIAAWDGSSWAPLGSGILGAVYALAVYNGQLIAGGYFTTAGGVSANYIAAWDGSSWSPLGTGTGGGPLGLGPGVYALAEYNGQLIAGGYFTSAGGVSANCIAAWDGSSWAPLGAGMDRELLDPRVFALAVYNGHLIAGGHFTTAGGVSANYIAAWDGSSWSPLGAGMNDGVFALAVYNGQLTAGGCFNTAADVIANKIAAWDGSWWCPLGTGMGGEVAALAEYNGRLIAGGYFATAGGVSANCIAAWDGSSWSPLGTGMDAAPIFEFGVYALAEYNGQLIAGGDFIRAGGVTVNGIAGWSY